jgi:hypothetical protein
VTSYCSSNANGVPRTPPPTCGEFSAELDKEDQSRSIALGAFIAGGALAVGTALTYVLWPSSDAKGDVGLTVRPGAGGAPGGATCRMTF